MPDFRFSPDQPVLQKQPADAGLVAAIILLWGLGLFTVLVASFSSAGSSFAQQFFPDRYYFFKRQLISSVIGFAGLFLFAHFKMSFIRRTLMPVLLLLSLALCLMTRLPYIGESRNNAARWIRLPFTTFQPAELAKLSLVLFFSNYFVRIRQNQHTWNSWVPVLILGIFCAIILILQSDMSTAILIGFVSVVMFFECGIEMRHLLKLMCVGLSVGILYFVNTPYRLKRVLAFLSPEHFAQTASYQPLMAKRAISAGGFFGVGVGSDMTKIFIPEVQTDYIFVGWTESMGFMGVLLFFIIAVFFFMRACKVACRTSDMFAAFGTFGCAAMLFFQMLLNCAVVCGVVPSTGIPLPFFSYGGSSLIITLAMCGFMINASRCRRPDAEFGGDVYE